MAAVECLRVPLLVPKLLSPALVAGLIARAFRRG